MKESIKTMDVKLTRAINATPEQVYDVWLDPKSPGGPWFGAARVIMNATVDGLFHHAVEHEGQTWPHYGRFIALERGRRIENTWMSPATRGLETILTVTLEQTGAQTTVTIHHTGIPDDEMGRGHREGWGFVLEMLGQRFAR